MCIRDRYQRRVHGELIKYPNLVMAESTERTFIMVKPDGVQRGLIGKIMSRFEDRGFKLVGAKLVQPPQEQLENHYDDLKERPFFPGLIKYMSSGPVVAMVWEGSNAVALGRKMLGATKPFDSEPGTIRGDYALEVGRNICHGSDSVSTANREIDIWFKKDEIFNWKKADYSWVFEK
eukprot:TRINITY_DN7426_c0_g1_i6.p2 TRINITY_DN7426_c0_g1~~TRINITY_DN7426_c0_g1_i6.p2  ORF type:complete len:177 (+),score=64.98 TRINITY_DN7426_c0_g1_i6:65-595(+)